MKVSIRLKFTAVFAIVLSAAIALCILFNGVYLEKYYVKNKVNAMLDACVELEEVLQVIGSESEADAAQAETTTQEENEALAPAFPIVDILSGETLPVNESFPADINDGGRGPWSSDNNREEIRAGL